MELLYKRLANLLTIKSLVTLIIVILFSVLSLRGSISPESVVNICTIVISFYFGTQFEKKANQ